MATTPNLATRVNQAVDKAAEHLVRLLCDDYPKQPTSSIARGFQDLALEMTGITASRLEWLSENDDNNSQYTLYYANLSALAMKACAKACDRMVY